MTEADFLQFLHERGLTAVDGPRAIEQLGREYGIRRWYDFIDLVYLPPSPLFLEHEEVLELVFRDEAWNGLNVAARRLLEFWALPL